ncbi:hypothetical protein [Paenibacillus sp. J22TS3]|uniref:hypothetical protein n=1 Tax=Paenibacillus sp. J22TS3 TaxID=2807192 RepID=UPI001B0D01E0|nr:hypothetical protein [Paenibacillus sp. J22TS3]GIP23306.1 hypothetical protein J22TS3_35810 [Paenibacillus sp. J22TS3]
MYRPQAGEVTETLNVKDDPEAILITDPNEIKHYAQKLNVPLTLPLYIPPKPTQISQSGYSQHMPPKVTPGGTHAGGAQGAAGYASSFYQEDWLWLFGFKIPEYKGTTCYRVFKTRIGKYKIPYPCFLTRDSQINYYGWVKYPRNIEELLKGEIKSCLIYAEGAAKGAGITAFIAAWEEGIAAAAAAGLSAAFSAWEIAMVDCLKKIPENIRNQVGYGISWWQTSLNDWH